MFMITPEIIECPAPDLPNCCRKESVSSLIQNERDEVQGEERFMIKSYLKVSSSMVSTSSMPTSATLFFRRYRSSNSFFRPPKVPTTMSIGTLISIFSSQLFESSNFQFLQTLSYYLGPPTWRSMLPPLKTCTFTPT